MTNNNNIKKIIIVNEMFYNELFYRRWELFAEDHKDFDVTLLAPIERVAYQSKGYTFGKALVCKGKEIDKENFHIRLYRQKSYRLRGVSSPDFYTYIKEIRPDVVYNIGNQLQYSLYHLCKIVSRSFPDIKIVAFSMRGRALSLNNVPKNGLWQRIIWKTKEYRQKYIYKKCDAFFCHYPDAVACFREEGYTGPLYMQTQVGVNPERYHPNVDARNEIREKYGLNQSYVFGTAARFDESKGIFDVLKAFPKDNDCKYFLMGSGAPEMVEKVKEYISELGLEKQVILPGFIERKDMPRYWNAIDCAIHIPRTTKGWEETFSIALVQAMATGKPVIGDDSGSVPYQLGPDGLYIHEGDVEDLKSKIEWVVSHKGEAREIGEKLLNRAVNCFSIIHLNELFYNTLIEDVLPGKYDPNKTDMANYR